MKKESNSGLHRAMRSGHPDTDLLIRSELADRERAIAKQRAELEKEAGNSSNSFVKKVNSQRQSEEQSTSIGCAIL